MLLTVHDQRYDRAETCAALRRRPELPEFRKQFGHIGLAVVGFSGITRGIDPRGAAESVNLQARVVCEAGQLRQSVDVAGLDLRVLLQRGAVLLHIAVYPEICRRKDLEALAENLRRLAELTPVGSSKYDLHGRKGSGKNHIFAIMINESQIDLIVKEMFRDIRFTSEPAGLYDPLRYMIEIGGKRLRPRLCLTTYSFFGDKFGDEILSPAAALEVFHSFTLMHDDIMDRSPLRRGVPTVWTRWNESTAILSGDVMLIDAYKRMARAPQDVHDKVMNLFFKTTVEVCEGQQYDMDFESKDMVSMEEYNRMIGLKTAVLIACSAKTGALIGRASDRLCDALYNYGYQLGMAFQIADDYLDAFGDEKVFGKPIGGDIVNSKKSWLTVRALEKSPDRKSFLEAFALPAESEAQKAAKISAVKQHYVSLGIDRDAKDEILRFTARAMKAVEDSELTERQLEELDNFAEKLTGRAK